MRRVLSAAVLFACCLVVAQPVSPVNNASVQNDSLGFSYAILEPVAGNTNVWSSKDTVKFRIFYIDVGCTQYDYRFARDGKSLIVKRTSVSADVCNADSEQLYAVEGKIAGVPKGKYLFELESVVGVSMSITFRDVAVVK
jgi:hypothetical protein